MKKSLMVVCAGAMLALLAGCSSNYVMTTKSGQTIVTQGKPKLDKDTGMTSYTDESGNFQTLTNVSLPWNRSFTAGSTVQAVTLTASTTSTSTVGVSGQTATAKLYIGTVLKQNVTQTSDATGRIQFSSITHTF